MYDQHRSSASSIFSFTLKGFVTVALSSSFVIDMYRYFFYNGTFAIYPLSFSRINSVDRKPIIDICKKKIGDVVYMLVIVTIIHQSSN